jgi:cobalt-zinc-cadmium efflux system membrane fusion protein
MTTESRLSVRRSVAILGAAALLLAGAVAAYLLMRLAHQPKNSPSAVADGAHASPPPEAGGHEPGTASANAGDPARAAREALPDVVVPISKEVMERAGIAVAAVSSTDTVNAIRLPGIVEANAYRQVAVTSLVSGRVTRVSPQLGDRVARGQTMAQVYSPELAEAQTRYISARARLDAHERELQRTEKLVTIGAASQQELEGMHAEHAAQTAEVQSTRSRLELLGVPASALDGNNADRILNATTSVPAPISGIVTERFANVGLNVDPAAKLFTVVDLSSVWVIADLYEKDFSRVRVGSATTITTAAYPGLALAGRVSYIDPQVSADTRTAKVRVEAPNPRGELRLGMYADVLIAAPSAARTAVAVPRSAVQNVADRQVVYLANPKEPGTFTEREVRLGRSSGDQVEVLSGLKADDVVVTGGSFFVRAERERLGLRSATPGAPSSHAMTHGNAGSGEAVTQTVRVTVGKQGFEPARLTLRAGVPARVIFVRTTDTACAEEIVFPSLQVKRALPLNQPVVIEFTPGNGDMAFACGMGMFSGTIVVE